MIERIMKEKEKEEEDLIELRVIDEIVLRWFHKYLKMFVSQIRYSLVVILGLNSVSGVQYKDMMIDR